MSDGRRVVLIGGTGMVGGSALRHALDDPRVGSVTSIGRRPTGLPRDPKLVEISHADFRDFTPLVDRLAGFDAALFCLGAYTGSIPDAEFRAVTADYPVAFAEALREHSPDVAFCFLSGAGADPTEKSRMSFARYKGAAEKALAALDFARLHVFRPGYIYPVEPRREPNLTYRLMRPLFPVLRRVHPDIGIPSHDLARAMLHAGLEGTAPHADVVLENRDIRALAARC
ncbi:MAG: hypothetical protein H6719_04580 [Sandaracinaceae bacterium]|nr:hypothetical protein [Sandaracinaceae bacterium]